MVSGLYPTAPPPPPPPPPAPALPPPPAPPPPPRRCTEPSRQLVTHLRGPPRTPKGFPRFPPGALPGLTAGACGDVQGEVGACHIATRRPSPPAGRRHLRPPPPADGGRGGSTQAPDRNTFITGSRGRCWGRCWGQAGWTPDADDDFQPVGTIDRRLTADRSRGDYRLGDYRLGDWRLLTNTDWRPLTRQDYRLAAEEYLQTGEWRLRRGYRLEGGYC